MLAEQLLCRLADCGYGNETENGDQPDQAYGDQCRHFAAHADIQPLLGQDALQPYLDESLPASAHKVKDFHD
jgi:hypothetical protein